MRNTLCIRTLCDLLATIHLGELLFNQGVALLTDLNDLRARDTELGHGSQDRFGDLCSSLVLGQGVGISQSVVYFEAVSVISC